MSNNEKELSRILAKLGIEKLNEMQLSAAEAINNYNEIVLLSPTGSGKTLAFLLPLIAQLDVSLEEVQLLILAPSRELAIQIESVARNMGTGHKINAVYGGRYVSKDKIELKQTPSILVGTPGRIGDHLRRGTFKADTVKILVLDEYDKSLEIGFEDEMSEILDSLPNLSKKILTSATKESHIPAFVKVRKPKELNFLKNNESQLVIKSILSPTKDKLETLVHTLSFLGDQPGIVFCNFKDAIQRISTYLTECNFNHGCFYGGLEQRDRERALIKFRNGTHNLILATDLAARGLDISEIKFIIHYHLPFREQEFIHRNGRTARMHNDGTAYVLRWEEEPLPEFIRSEEIENIPVSLIPPSQSKWTTVFISGGRKDKISKGDIAGLFLKQGALEKEDLGLIELKNDCAFVAVNVEKASPLVTELDNIRLKKKKVRINLI